MKAKETATHFIEVWNDKLQGEVISDSGDPLPISDYSLCSATVLQRQYLDPICVFWIKPR